MNRDAHRTAMRRIAALTALVLVASCTSSGDDDSDTADQSVSPDDVIETVTVVTSGGEVEARVHPLVEVEDHLVLTVDLVATEIADGDDFGVPGSRFEGDATLTGSSSRPEEAGALRLVDPSAPRRRRPASTSRSRA